MINSHSDLYNNTINLLNNENSKALNINLSEVDNINNSYYENDDKNNLIADENSMNILEYKDQDPKSKVLQSSKEGINYNDVDFTLNDDTIYREYDVEEKKGLNSNDASDFMLLINEENLTDEDSSEKDKKLFN